MERFTDSVHDNAQSVARSVAYISCSMAARPGGTAEHAHLVASQLLAGSRPTTI